MQDFLQKKTFFYKKNKFFIVYMTTIYFNCIHVSYKKSAFIPDACIGDESRKYVTTIYQGKKGETKTEKYNMDFSEWKKLKKGEKIELKINFNGFAEINNKK